MMSAGAAVGLPAAAQGPELAVLGTLDKGAWTVRVRPDGPTTRICVRTGQEFIQLRHRQLNCDRFVVDDQPGETTVQYTCRGHGYGRTSVRREGNRLVQLRSQGTEDGKPFSVDAEARYAGAC
ncbi:hypothetical protein [Aurantiacibacter suaedae]|uniref:hypothetical protein n=1 Tax=Aurantiacibacter suaedae TaxID=2545755 RepID=UPI001F4F691C|nr:hypothetical protein [Aurantiacibacter suaedae]